MGIEPPNMNPFAVLMIGGLDLLDGSNYQLVEGGWSPTVAARRESVLTNKAHFEDVIEELRINVYGSTAAECLENLQTLSAVLDRAEQFAAGNHFTPVLFEVQAQGSALPAPISSLVLGRAGRGELLVLPRTFSDLLSVYVIKDVLLRFVRRGPLLAQASSYASPTVQVPGPFSLGLGSLPLTRPSASLKVTLSGLSEIPSGILSPSLLLVGSSNSILTLEGEAMSGTWWSVVNDSGNLARGNSIGRFSPTTTQTQAIIGNLSVPRGRVAIWALMRSNSATNFMVTAQLSGATGVTGSARPTFVLGSPAQPKIVYLGTIDASHYGSQVRLLISAFSPGTTLDVDYLALLHLDHEVAAAVEIDALSAGSPIDALTVDHLALEATRPAAYYTLPGGNDRYPVGARGRLWLVDNPGDTGYRALWLSTRDNKWRPDNGLGTVADAHLVVEQRATYLVPQ